MDDDNLRGCLHEMMELSNVSQIEKVIREKLAGKYRMLLCQDIERDYKDIIYALKHTALEKKKETGEIIKVSYASRQEVEQKLEEQKKNYEEIRKNSEQLTMALHMVEENTNKRLNRLLAL